MGYVRAVLTELALTGQSWTAWGQRPGVGGDCNQPDLNDGTNLYSSALHSGNGANWASLFPTFYGQLSAATPTNNPTQPANTVAPTLATTKAPTNAVTKTPTTAVTKAPTNAQQTNAPSNAVTKAPTTPTNPVTKAPSTAQQTGAPTNAVTKAPTKTQPTNAPVTKAPTTVQQTNAPSTGTQTTTFSPTKAGSDNKFNLQIVFTDDSVNNANVVAAVNSGAARWTQVITGDFGNSLTIAKGQAVCGLPPTSVDIVVDDVLMFVQVTAIDGPGGVGLVAYINLSGN